MYERNIRLKEDFGAIKETEQKEAIYGFTAKSHESGLRTLKYDVRRVRKKHKRKSTTFKLPAMVDILPNKRIYPLICFSSRRLKNNS